MVSGAALGFFAVQHDEPLISNVTATIPQTIRLI
jgi:hypothetical protein